MVTIKRNSNGAVLPLFAIALFLLIGLVAVGVNAYLVEASRTQLSADVEYMTRSALERFVRYKSKYPKDSPQAFAEKIEAARSRAAEIGSFAVLVGYKKRAVSSRGEVAVQYSGQTQGGPVGELIPGRYWFREPPSCSPYDPAASCPCPGGKWNKPCFEAVKKGDPLINAFRMKVRTRKNNPINNFLGRFMGTPHSDLEETATVAVAPQRFIFLVDLSRSV
ncbi:MAG: hypothetical protein D6719_07105, partial [Candidatus Dadabacteria bacterium]